MKLRNFIAEFEEEFSSYINVDYSIGTSMGRTALYALLRALCLHKGDEIIIPAYICGVVPNAIIKNECIPVFVDINKENYHISINQLKSKISRRTRAIIINHIFGYPEDVDKIKSIIENCPHKIYLIEDGAHALGSEYKGHKIGSLGDACIFSFTKNTINIGGGAVTTNNSSIAANLRKIIKGSSKLPLKYKCFFGISSLLDVNRIDSKFCNSLMNILEEYPNKLESLTREYNRSLKLPRELSMSHLQASLASSQIRTLDNQNLRRNNNQSTLDDLLRHFKIIKVIKSDIINAKHVCTWYVIKFDTEDDLVNFINESKRNHIYFTRFWYPLHISQINLEKANLLNLSNSTNASISTAVFKMNPNIKYETLKEIGEIMARI